MNSYYSDATLTLLSGKAEEVLPRLPDGSADCCVTSPPYYGLRDYGVEGQLGLESTPDEYVTKTVAIFRQVRRVLADDGTLWLNLGDSYSGSWGNQSHQPGPQASSPIGQPHDERYPTRRRTGAIKPGAPPAKNLFGMPWRVAFALQTDGWILRNAIVWHKTNPMPESVKDRVSSTYEHVFLFTKSRKYWFDLDAIREQYDGDRALSRRAHRTANKPNTARGTWPARHEVTDYRIDRDHQAVNVQGRNPGDVWSIPTQPYPGAHFAPMPLRLATRCVLAGCRPGGTVLDPFCGTGVSLLAAQRTGRRGFGIDLKPDYLQLAMERCQQAPLVLDDGGAA